MDTQSIQNLDRLSPKNAVKKSGKYLIFVDIII